MTATSRLHPTAVDILRYPQQRFQSHRKALRNQSQIQPQKLVPYHPQNKAQVVRVLVELCSQYLMTSWPSKTYRLPLRSFVHEVLRRSRSSYPVFQVALYYITRLRPIVAAQSESLSPGLSCGRRVFVAALMIASKYLQDRNFGMQAWNKISGLPSADLAMVELEVLKALDWNLHVPCEVYEQCCRKLERFLTPSAPANMNPVSIIPSAETESMQYSPVDAASLPTPAASPMPNRDSTDNELIGKIND